MCLPGITGAQMIEVDRIIVNELEVPIELMMEHPGLSLARLLVIPQKHMTMWQSCLHKRLCPVETN